MNENIKMNAPEVHQCSKCGACLTVCPVYAELRDETVSPRAKVQLIGHYAEKGLSPSARLNELVDRCLMCGNCVANCPSGVVHNRLFMRMRSYMASDWGVNWKLRALYLILTRKEREKLAARFARLGRNVVLERMAREVRMGNIPVKKLPKFSRSPFRDKTPEVTGPQGEPAGTILYFTGCGTNHLYEDVGQATVKVLSRMGFKVVIPKEQLCCGLPVFAHGGMDKAINNIEANVAIFNRPGITAVITDCATCGSALKKEYPVVLEEVGKSAKKAKSLGKKVRDITEFMADNFNLLAPFLNRGMPGEKVTYHSPCHMKNFQGITKEVEELLSRLPNVDYVRARDFDNCCGGGGTFFYDYPEVSGKIVARKIENAQKTGAKIWATGCPGCRLNLAGNLPPGVSLKIVHPVQIVEQALIPQ